MEKKRRQNVSGCWWFCARCLVGSTRLAGSDCLDYSLSFNDFCSLKLFTELCVGCFVLIISNGLVVFLLVNCILV